MAIVQIHDVDLVQFELQVLSFFKFVNSSQFEKLNACNQINFKKLAETLDCWMTKRSENKPLVTSHGIFPLESYSNSLNEKLILTAVQHAFDTGDKPRIDAIKGLLSEAIYQLSSGIDDTECNFNLQKAYPELSGILGVYDLEFHEG